MHDPNSRIRFYIQDIGAAVELFGTLIAAADVHHENGREGLIAALYLAFKDVDSGDDLQRLLALGFADADEEEGMRQVRERQSAPTEFGDTPVPNRGRLSRLVVPLEEMGVDGRIELSLVKPDYLVTVICNNDPEECLPGDFLRILMEALYRLDLHTLVLSRGEEGPCEGHMNGPAYADHLQERFEQLAAG